MRYLTDGEWRHLICDPLSIKGLHAMARKLGIKRCWYHAGGGGRFPHYDVPKKMIGKLPASVEFISTRQLLEVIHKQFIQGGNTMATKKGSNKKAEKAPRLVVTSKLKKEVESRVGGDAVDAISNFVRELIKTAERRAIAENMKTVKAKHVEEALDGEGEEAEG